MKHRVTLAPCEYCGGKMTTKDAYGNTIACLCKTGTIGCYNDSADKLERIDEVASDTNLTGEYPESHKFTRHVCACGSKAFEVLHTDSYETTAQCVECGAYYIVHNG